MVMRIPLVCVCTLAWLCIGGCKLEEQLPLSPGDATVVVHAVINAAADSQFVLVEYSDDGTRIPVQESQTLFGQILPTRPISDATVELRVTPALGTCSPAEVHLFELPPDTGQGSTETGSGVYLTRDLCALHSGDVLTLTVVTPAGEVVTGQTTIPDATGIAIALVPSGPHLDTVRLRRDRDSVWVHGDNVSAAAFQIEVAAIDVRFSPFQDLSQVFLTDSLGTVIPGDLVPPFQSNPNPPLFRAGQFYTFVVAATDQNFYDFARSGSDPFTGRGFINHLEGGIGVFGSIDVRRSLVRVSGPRTDSREGVYRVTGAIDGAPVDMSLDVYLHDSDFGQGGPSFVALAEGRWAGEPIVTNARGQFDAHRVDGVFGFAATFVGGTAPDTTRYHVRGDPGPPGTPFTVETLTEGGEGVGVLFVVQEPGAVAAPR